MDPGDNLLGMCNYHNCLNLLCLLLTIALKVTRHEKKLLWNKIKKLEISRR